MANLEKLSTDLRVIQDVLPQIPTLQNSLRDLSKRLNYIFRTVLFRDPNLAQDRRFPHAISTFSFFVLRTERVLQRLLQSALGSKAWSIDEIALEINRIRIDVDGVLQPGDVVPEVVTENDAGHIGVPEPSEESEYIMVQLAELEITTDSVLLASPGGTSTSWTPHILRRAESLLSEARSAGSDVLATDISIKKINDSDTIFTRLAEENKQTVTLHGAKDPQGRSLNVRLKSIGLRSSPADLKKALKRHYPDLSVPDQFEQSKAEIKVTESVDQYDAMAPGGLQIAESTPLIWWWNKYCAFHGDQGSSSKNSTPMHTRVALKEKNSVSLGGVDISFHRTLRVPDQNGKKNSLPPSLGTFPLEPVAKHLGKVDDTMKAHGGLMMTMTEREAMWMSFKSISSGPGPALKIYVGGINALTGTSMLDTTPPKDQDYVVIGKQPWLDGVMTEEGTVRQFVGMRLGSGYTVEEQITKKAVFGGIQLDVFPRRAEPPSRTFTHPDTSAAFAADKTPQELGLKQLRNTISFDPWKTRNIPSEPTSKEDPWSLEGYRRKTGSLTLTAYYRPPRPSIPMNSPWGDLTEREVRRNRPAARLGAAQPMPMMMCAPCAPSAQEHFRPDDTSRARIGLAAGGAIDQKIYPDTVSIRMYDQHNVKRLFLHIVSTDMWQDITGVLPPFKPLGPADYQRYGIPWFVLSDGQQGTLTKVSSLLRDLKSVAELDVEKAAAAVAKAIDPTHPGRCAKHTQMVITCVFRPCDHGACDTCIGSAMRTRKCTQCSAAILKFVGVSEPIADVVQDEGGTEGSNEWNVVQIEQLANAAVQDGYITVIHRMDGVSLFNKHK